ncbi:MAG: 30S ribosome-binding factor RbfA [Desulfitobacteriia bacterium]|jgi:ribosome-binding factor A
MVKHRAFRLAEAIKIEVSRIIREEIKDPRLGFVTVTAVEVTDDLRHAKIFVSIMGDKAEIKKNMDVLTKASSYVRSELGKNIRVRYVPEIVFKHDQSIEHGVYISKLLRDVGVDGENDEGENS